MTAAFSLLRAKDLLARGKPADARQVLDGILRETPGAAAAHHLLSKVHQAMGKVEDALNAAAAAHRLDPASAEFAVHLGAMLVELRLPEHALPLLRQAHAKQPASCDTNETLARCYMDMEKGHRALPHFEAALAAAPDDDRRAQLTLALAECRAATNDAAGADALLKTLAETARNPVPAIIMRGLGAARPIPEELIQQLQALQSDAGLPADARAQVLLALGRIADLGGRPDDAFALWTQSRALLGVRMHQGAAVATRNMQTRGIYGKAVLEAAVPFGEPSASPIFIAGMPRSGTTLTAQILSAHPEIVSIGETDRLNKLDVTFRRDHWGPDAGRRIMESARKGRLLATARELQQFFAVFLEPGRNRIVEKTPTNYESLGFIYLCFPKARFIHCRRHPADNFVSAFQHNMNRLHDYTYDQTAFAERYLAQEDIMSHWKQCFPGQVLELSYENLVARPEQEIRRLVAFCGLPWDDACLNFHQTASTVRTFSRDQVRQPIYASSVERWRKYEKHLETLFARLNQSGYSYSPRAQ